MTEAFDTVRADLARQLECVQHDIDQDTAILAAKGHERDLLAVRLQAMDHARELLAQADPPATRPDVQGAAMATISHAAAPGEPGDVCGLKESEIIVRTGLPAASVHVFLQRAVRTGKLVVIGDGFYFPPPTSAAPVADRAQDAA